MVSFIQCRCCSLSLSKAKAKLGSGIASSPEAFLATTSPMHHENRRSTSHRFRFSLDYSGPPPPLCVPKINISSFLQNFESIHKNQFDGIGHPIFVVHLCPYSMGTTRQWHHLCPRRTIFVSQYLDSTRNPTGGSRTARSAMICPSNQGGPLTQSVVTILPDSFATLWSFVRA